MQTDSGIQVLSRAARILRLFKAGNAGFSLGNIASQTGLPRSTVQRIVNALVQEGFMAASGKDGDLRLGPEVFALASAQQQGIAPLLRPLMEKLADKTGETVDLAIFRQTHLTFVDQVPGRHRLRTVSEPGVDFPLWTTANGKAILSLLPDHQVDALFQAQKPAGTVAALDAELQEITQTGLAYDLDDHTAGISAASFAFRGSDGHLYAMSVPTPTTRFTGTRQDIAACLMAIKEELAGSALVA